MEAKILNRSYFGEFSRYCIITMLSRFGAIEYFILDATVTDEVTGYAGVIFQTSEILKLSEKLQSLK
jgi:hypothetical protein